MLHFLDCKIGITWFQNNLLNNTVTNVIPKIPLVKYIALFVPQKKTALFELHFERLHVNV